MGPLVVAELIRSPFERTARLACSGLSMAGVLAFVKGKGQRLWLTSYDIKVIEPPRLLGSDIVAPFSLQGVSDRELPMGERTDK
jgi:hypothetical protein